MAFQFVAAGASMLPLFLLFTIKDTTCERDGSCRGREPTPRRHSCASPLREIHFLETLLQLRGERAADGKAYAAGVVKCLRDDAGLHVLHNLHDIIHCRIGDRIVHHLLANLLFYAAVGETIYRGFAVCDDKSGRAEVHSAIVSDHDDKRVRQFRLHKLSVDGFARR